MLKAELAAQNAALRARVSELEVQLIAERELHHSLTSKVTIPSSLRVLPEHMQRAREMAMRSGITVRVG